MKIPVHLIPEGESEYQYLSSSDEALGELKKSFEKQSHEFNGPLEFSASLARAHDDFFLRGCLKCELALSCSRCLEKFPFRISSDFVLALHLNEHASREALAADSEEVDVIYFKGPDFSFIPLVEEQFFLALPFKPLCEEGCRGLCQECGVNRNQQPCECRPTIGFNPFSQLKDKHDLPL